MRADLGKKLIFPREIASITLRPNIVMWSESIRSVAMVELTVPWEERVEEAHHSKKTKYEGLQQECIDNRWRAWVIPVEVGCRGFPAQSLWSALRLLGVTGQRRKVAIQNILQAAGFG